MPALSQVFIDGLTRQAVDLRRFEDSAARAVERVLRQAERDILADLAERSARRQLTRPGSSITWREARMAEVLENLNATLATAYDQIETRVGKRIQDAAAFSFESTADVLEQSLAPLGGLATVNTVAVGPELLERISRDAFVNIGAGAAVVGEWWSSQEGKIRENIARSFRAGMLLGEGVPGLTRRIQDTATGLPVARRWAEAVARTSVISAGEEARNQVYNANRHVVKGVYHYSTLDRRTTVICITYSGKGWLRTEDGRLEPSGHSLPFGSGVPRHVSCRSITLPWLRTWEEQGFDANELNPRLRRAFGDRATGPRGDLTDALKADPDLARKVLGRTRYDLWQSGRATLDDFVDARTGQPWKVAELRTMFADGGKPPTVKAKKGPKATVLPKEKTLSGPEIREQIEILEREIAEEFEAIKAQRAPVFVELDAVLQNDALTPAQRQAAYEPLRDKIKAFARREREIEQGRRPKIMEMLKRGKTVRPEFDVKKPILKAGRSESLRDSPDSPYFPKWQEDAIDETVRDIASIWNRPLQTTRRLRFKKVVSENGRPYFNNFDTVYMDARASRDTIFHEVGHWLEAQDKEVHAKILDFYQKRTEFEAVEWIGEGYNIDEMTRPDGFAHRYMGKVYWAPDKGQYATEILSMGLEWLWSKPTEFARRDPEMFDFIIDLLRGG